jgi:RNA polymerase sigma-70 factor (ECF subfamily)
LKRICNLFLGGEYIHLIEYIPIESSEVMKLDYPERELVNKSKNGDMDAFSELISSYEKKIYNIALRMIGNREDAYDMAQEVCIKIYKNINSFKGDSSFSTWVYRITSNVCIDEIRKKKYAMPLTMVNDSAKEFEIPIESHNSLPEDIIERKEKIKDIKKCIIELPPEYRIMIILRDIRGHSYEEISNILNLNMGTVKSRLSRARAILKDKLKNMEQIRNQIV